MKIECTSSQECQILHINEARIDAFGAIKFKEHMRNLIGDGHKRVILDLTNVTFVDSSGLGALVAIHKLLSPNRKLELASLAPAVTRVLQLTHMDQVFPIHANISDAFGNAI